VRVELANPVSAESRRLLAAHEADMAVRYPTGAWAGTGGRKDVFWVARGEDGRAVGCVALRVLTYDVVEVKHLFVDPSARRLGAASVLMDAVEQEAHARNSRIVLETGVEQPEALALYRSRGYRERSRYEGSDADGEGSVYFEREVGLRARDSRLRLSGSESDS
jgi:ribosomal protein S18 acetylase RimI-like enzyme